jgi:excisionase family DNA binding protein
MTYYNLQIVGQHKTLSTPAGDRKEALAIFGKELGLKLTLENSNTAVISYLLDEWEIGPHWVNPTIPVFGIPLATTIDKPISLPMSGPTTLSVPEAGQRLGPGRNASYEAARRGELPVLRFGRKLRVPSVALERLLTDARLSAAAFSRSVRPGSASYHHTSFLFFKTSLLAW